MTQRNFERPEDIASLFTTLKSRIQQAFENSETVNDEMVNLQDRFFYHIDVPQSEHNMKRLYKFTTKNKTLNEYLKDVDDFIDIQKRTEVELVEYIGQYAKKRGWKDGIDPSDTLNALFGYPTHIYNKFIIQLWLKKDVTFSQMKLGLSNDDDFLNNVGKQLVGCDSLQNAKSIVLPLLDKKFDSERKYGTFSNKDVQHLHDTLQALIGLGDYKEVERIAFEFIHDPKYGKYPEFVFWWQKACMLSETWSLEKKNTLYSLLASENVPRRRYTAYLYYLQNNGEHQSFFEMVEHAIDQFSFDNLEAGMDVLHDLLLLKKLHPVELGPKVSKAYLTFIKHMMIHRQAIDLHNKRLWEALVVHVMKNIVEFSESAGLWTLYGVGLGNTDRGVEARKALLTALTLKPSSALAATNYIASCLHTEDAESALKAVHNYWNIVSDDESLAEVLLRNIVRAIEEKKIKVEDLPADLIDSLETYLSRKHKEE